MIFRFRPSCSGFLFCSFGRSESTYEYIECIFLALTHYIKDNIDIKVCWFCIFSLFLGLCHYHLEWFCPRSPNIYRCFLCDSSMQAQQHTRSYRQLGSMHTMLQTYPKCMPCFEHYTYDSLG